MADDPWSRLNNNHQNVNICESNLTKFEDNFVPANSDKLPDHEEYLALLESKLRKLKSDPSLLRQLEAKREACMRQLLTEESDYSNFDQLQESVAESPLLRTFLPQKQALNQGEIVEFIKYDQLIEDQGQDSNNTEQDKVREE